MTGNDIFKRCLALLGYTQAESEAVSCKALLNRMPEIIASICFDLKITPVFDLEGEITANDTQLDALCCGCTMLLALSEGEGGKHRLFTELYNARRAAALSEISTVKDCLPVTDGGL